MDMALIAQAAALESRLPFIHFFDGFRTSHEVAKIEQLTDRRHARDDRATNWCGRIASARLSPDHPVLRGTAQNPDVYFQARETVNPFYDAAPRSCSAPWTALPTLTGRQYRSVRLFRRSGCRRVIVLMGSGALAAEECVEALKAQGRKGRRGERAFVPAILGRVRL